MIQPRICTIFQKATEKNLTFCLLSSQAGHSYYGPANQPARRSNQSILKEISPGCSLEGLMLKLKLQYFGHLMRRVDSLEKTLMLGGMGAGGEGDDRGWDGWMTSPTRWTWVWVNSGAWWWTGRPGVLQLMGSQRVRHDWVTELNWTLFCCLVSLLQFQGFIVFWEGQNHTSESIVGF